MIDGSIDSDPPPTALTLVVLLRSDTGEAVDSFALRRGRYFFRVPSGTYFVAAFIDVDRNFHYDPVKERGVWFGAPDPIRVAKGQAADKVNLSLHDSGAVVMERPLIAPELGHRGMHDLPDVNIGTVTTAADPRFSSENGRLGMWQPVDFALSGLPGVYFLEPFDTEKIPVLFVHGITGHPGEFAYLIKNLDHSRFQAWVLYYPSGGRLDLIAAVAGRWLNSVAARYPIERLAIVAHSMGGLVARSLINQWVVNVGDARVVNLDAFVSISTPWGGHAAAAAGVEHAPEVVPSWYDMKPGSEFLRNLFTTKLPPECSYQLLFGYEGRSALIGGANDGTVAVSSELALEAQEQAVKVYGFPESHAGILNSPEVSARLNRILAEAVTD